MTFAARQLSQSAPALSAPPSRTRACGGASGVPRCGFVAAGRAGGARPDACRWAGPQRGPGRPPAAGSGCCPPERLAVRGADLSARWPIRCWVAWRTTWVHLQTQTEIGVRNAGALS